MPRKGSNLTRNPDPTPMFKNLKRFDITQATAWVDMPELGPNARICVKPATDANSSYYNAMLKLAGRRVRQMVKTDEITAEDAAKNRDDDRRLYPRFIIETWENIEADGKPGSDGVDDDGHVIFTPFVAKELCDKLPNHLMDKLRNTASTPERFYPVEDDLPPDPVELAGKSRKGSGTN